MSEEWRQLLDIPNYEFSSLGRIRRTVPRFKTQWVGQFVNLNITNKAKGYIRATINGNTVDVHPLFCRAFNGPKPTSKHEAAHNDGNRHNNAACNLRWSTRKDNHADKLAHNTLLYGSKCLKTTLTELDVQEIIHRYANGESASSIASSKNINHKNIAGIIRGERCWKYVESPDREAAKAMLSKQFGVGLIRSKQGKFVSITKVLGGQDV